jgi:catechol 2,3-dioxygenase-like lactoylglutathione lyase family enzyme
MTRARIGYVVPVLMSADIERTAAYYSSVLGFQVVEHHEDAERFIALYRDNVEILVVQARRGEVEANSSRFGAGYDAYIGPDDLEGVDLLHAEFVERGARILVGPRRTPYGSYEFVVQDIDGRRIGVGRILNGVTPQGRAR